MARGLCSDFKALVGVAFVGRHIHWRIIAGLLERALEACQKAELKVRAIVCDQNRSNLKALRMARDNDVQYRLTSRLNIIHDYVHLFRNIRKNVELHDFQFGTNIMFWDIIEQFNMDDEMRTTWLAPNLNCSQKKTFTRRILIRMYLLRRLVVTYKLLLIVNLIMF